MQDLKIIKERGPKVVKTYRINETLFNEAESKCKQRYGVGLASLIGPLLKSFFKIEDKK